LYIQKYLKNNLWIAYIIAVVLFIFSIFLGISIGTVSIPFDTIWNIFLHKWFSVSLGKEIDPTLINIVMDIRLPRVILAGLVGASLALAGAALQGLLKNPLADPYTLGVSSGASVGAVFVIFFGLSLPIIGKFTLPFLAIIGGFMTIFAVILFTKFVDRMMKMETIILTGIIFSSFLGAFLSLMIALTGEELRQVIYWLLGGVSMRGWDYIYIMLPFFFIGSLLLLMNGTELNILSFGEEKAKHLGVQVPQRKMMILSASSILTGAAVAVSGTIGFVGLVIPHLTRLAWGTDHRHLLPLSLLHGAAFLIAADLVARTIISPTELPIGVITAMIGAPVFAIILIRQRMKGNE
jgi:iron complex transport system permease protein